MIYNVKHLKCSLWVLAFLSPSHSSLTIFDILWCAWIPLLELPNFPNKCEHLCLEVRDKFHPWLHCSPQSMEDASRKDVVGKPVGLGQHSATFCTSCWTHEVTSSGTKSKGWFSQKVTAQRRSWLSHWPFPPKASIEASPQMKTDNPIWVEKLQFKGKSISAYSSYSWPPESRVARSSHFILLIIPFAK